MNLAGRDEHVDVPAEQLREAVAEDLPGGCVGLLDDALFVHDDARDDEVGDHRALGGEDGAAPRRMIVIVRLEHDDVVGMAVHILVGELRNVRDDVTVLLVADNVTLVLLVEELAPLAAVANLDNVVVQEVLAVRGEDGGAKDGDDVPLEVAGTESEGFLHNLVGELNHTLFVDDEGGLGVMLQGLELVGHRGLHQALHSHAPLALLDPPDDSRKRLVRLREREPDLEQLSVAVLGHDRPALPNHPGLSLPPVAAQILVVLPRVVLIHQHAHVLAEDLLPVPAEHVLRRLVEEIDHPAPVDHHHGVDEVLHDVRVRRQRRGRVTLRLRP
mmetsp:Transcript_20992/g.59054  ORF Transcript_20992/g.59054 Transcript_20992/m.59054 type:complete len:329 (+) Transcript_20992:816-1802(+)